MSVALLIPLLNVLLDRLFVSTSDLEEEGVREKEGVRRDIPSKVILAERMTAL